MTGHMIWRAVLVWAVMMAVSLLQPARAEANQRTEVRVDVLSEAQDERGIDVAPDEGLGIELTARLSWPDAVLAGGRDRTSAVAIGASLGAFGGYSEVLRPRDDGGVDEFTLYIGDLRADNLWRLGVELGLSFSDDSDWDREHLRVDLLMRVGAAFIEYEKRPASDLIEITRGTFLVLEPALLLHTPLRLASTGSRHGLVLTAGLSAPIYTGQAGLLTAARINLGLLWIATR